MTSPSDFRHTFLKGGHKLVERTYGHSNAVIRQLIAKCGGSALLAERRAVQGTGRKAGQPVKQFIRKGWEIEEEGFGG
ncbi:hypothetical protein [Companilactobacillus sp.]|uniref:hypothetical protein n=1 Tax=Companilactobacillus sp. TaxID=2767905 RepID=UPI00262D6222|nr:hypothetical protein [Companilactobacillus sp.]